MNGESGKGRVSWCFMGILIAGFLTTVLAACSTTAQQGEASGARMISPTAGICKDVETGLMWQSAPSKAFTSLADAEAYVAKLNIGGYDDWRLPSVTELYGLYMTFDLHENGGCKMNVEGTYWSDEEDLEGRVGTWELDDNCDPERRYIPKQRGKVRAVRK